ncbi:class I SAM-dependent methyltransferase [Gracilibacillus oryzae]|uniref:Class I SAM-dependent methyltransferase n=1 Tax=Gracilibacillus oryzae TaxID=1672701 RepID=A0A7C8L3K4_9BACI|nr:class I SAM-dependent methyltransferase [Gracilibacillus oryzae]KAB8135778.1 class I SAM-dependent methyltransferase [Gracilibacillus oryzae]
MQKEKLIRKYDKQVKLYEKNRHNPTLAKWRREMLKDLHGNVLEVGIGAGANLAYYNKQNVHVTGVDFSVEMLKSAKKAADYHNVSAEFLLKDVDTLDFEPDSFDCIVSTLTLCSYQEPVRVLGKFNKWCKQGGSIRLLEHGLSSHSFLSFSQKLIDPLFKRVSGCHCDRDIIQLVNKTDISIEHIERYWTDMVYLVWAKPSIK